MKLRYLGIRRYRCLREFSLDVDDFLVILGHNNAGKSTLLQALSLLLSSSVRGIDENAFFRREIGAPIILTSEFGQLAPWELEVLGPWIVDDVLCLRKEYSLEVSGRIAVTYCARVQVPTEEWLKDDFEDYSKRDVVSKLPLAPFLPSGGKISRDAYKAATSKYKAANPDRIEYRVEWVRNPTGFKAALERSLPEIHLLPALRDVTDETRPSSTTLLGKLTSAMADRVVQANSAAYDRLQHSLEQIRQVVAGPDGNKMDEIRELQARIESVLAAWDVKLDLQIDVPDIQRLFLSGISLSVDDGVPTSIEEKGHGLQRSLLFSLIRLWADYGRQNEASALSSNRRSLIFAFEEPELYLHPQMCRAVYDDLKVVSASEQVILCTHSSHFVNMEDYRHLVIIRRDREGSRSYRAAQDLFEGESERKQRFNMIAHFNPDRSEVFFARKVALVEGQSEKAALPVIARRLEVFDHGVTIIDCGGKGNLPLYMVVLNSFQIPYIAIYDEDRKDADENNRIEALCDRKFGSTYRIPKKFDDFCCIPKGRRDKIGKPYAAVEHFGRESIPVPPHVAALVEAVYARPVSVSEHEPTESKPDELMRVSA